MSKSKIALVDGQEISLPTDALPVVSQTSPPAPTEKNSMSPLAEQVIFAIGSEIELRLLNYESISEAIETLENYSIRATKLTVYLSHDQYIWMPYETIWLENGEPVSSQRLTKWTTDLPWRLKRVLLSAPLTRIFGRSLDSITTPLRTSLKWSIAKLLPSRFTPRCLLGTPRIILEESMDLDQSSPDVSYAGFLPLRHTLKYLDSTKTPGGISFTLIGFSSY